MLLKWKFGYGFLTTFMLALVAGCHFSVHNRVTELVITDVKTGEPIRGAEVIADHLHVTPDFVGARIKLPYRLAPTDERGITYAPVRSRSPNETPIILLAIEKDGVSESLSLKNRPNQQVGGEHFSARIVSIDAYSVPSDHQPTLNVIEASNPPMFEIDGYVDGFRVCSVDEQKVVWRISSTGWYLETLTIGQAPESFNIVLANEPFGESANNLPGNCNFDIPDDAPTNSFAAWVIPGGFISGRVGPVFFCLDDLGAVIECEE